MYRMDWKNSYEQLNLQDAVGAHLPVIGITGNCDAQTCSLATGYYQSVLEAGAIPLILPPLLKVEQLASILERVDGLLLSGGADVNPLLVSEEPLPSLHSINPRRDAYELLLIRMAYDRQIPILGICRGIQLLAIALEGSIYQDLAAQHPKPLIKHNQDLERGYPSHTVNVEPDTLLSSLFSSPCLEVNSFHHQAVKEVGKALRVVARSSDDVIEAVESAEYKSIIGVQWHPECFLLEGDRTMLPLFEWLRDEATSYARARTLHQRLLTLDSHCDTPMFFEHGINFRHRDKQLLVDSHKMKEGGLDASIMVAYLPQGERTPSAHQAATEKAEQLLSRLEAMVDDCPSFALARTPADLYRLKRAGTRAILMGIENGYAIGTDLSRIAHFRKRGVVYMTLCHNGDNAICDSARGTSEHGGVSAFGKEVIAEMNRTGMMVDLSHASEQSFYDALAWSKTPIVCSHSSARALCNHPRNLTDDQLRALAKAGGVVQVTLYHGFLRTEGEATLHDAVRHLNHLVAVAGIDHVGIGTDFDGDGGVTGCASAAELLNFTRQLVAEGYSEQEIEKIWGANFLRVMNICQNYKSENQ